MVCTISLSPVRNTVCTGSLSSPKIFMTSFMFFGLPQRSNTLCRALLESIISPVTSLIGRCKYLCMCENHFEKVESKVVHRVMWAQFESIQITCLHEHSFLLAESWWHSIESDFRLVRPVPSQNYTTHVRLFPFKSNQRSFIRQIEIQCVTACSTPINKNLPN